MMIQQNRKPSIPNIYLQVSYNRTVLVQQIIITLISLSPFPTTNKKEQQHIAQVKCSEKKSLIAENISTSCTFLPN